MQPAGCSDNLVQAETAYQNVREIEQNLIHIETSLASTDDQIQEYLLKNPQELTLELTEEMSPESRILLLQSLKARIDNMSYPNTRPETHRVIAVAVSMLQTRKLA